MKPKIAVTMGDPAGVGPEICLEVLRDAGVTGEIEVLVFGDAGVLERVAKRTGQPGPERVVGWEEWRERRGDVAGSLVVDFRAVSAAEVEPGRVNAATGRAAYRYVEASIEAALAGWVAGVATGPIHKEALHAAGVPFPGHTEMFAKLTGARRSCMMLTSPQMTCSFVTGHVGYGEVPGLLSVERILEVIELTDEALVRLRGQRMRLVVNGLNPHAGEGGLFGEGEEERVIGPAVARARGLGIEVTGPLSPDTAFLPERLAETGAYVCMYHDQGLIPLKMLAFDTAVNVTLGLPIVRTSVDHGTALDLAWQGKARSTSLREAVRLAARLAGDRFQTLRSSLGSA